MFFSVCKAVLLAGLVGGEAGIGRFRALREFESYREGLLAAGRPKAVAEPQKTTTVKELSPSEIAKAAKAGVPKAAVSAKATNRTVSQKKVPVEVKPKMQPSKK
eukprot:gnl/MRDRNA2_/MRDRNA2_94545_c0_seq1.p1 gnl/MRDRNA2_/MRDRNA2_94545_c0~~gnl/MRDRNA2_/MRDRNA2_94545_c0_seq1.p1  ORF type:complete len:104 (-),score=16.44 gnl/MRDRNA2_/MRDRNA2_94545_c0_seq1:66-377(-)